MMPENILISIVGPTAIGKTALSIKLAHYFNTEIISADSRQFFKEMHIGTAAPTAEELAAAKHHFIHHKSIQELYSVGAFEKDALDILKELFKKRDSTRHFKTGFIVIESTPNMPPTITNLNTTFKRDSFFK